MPPRKKDPITGQKPSEKRRTYVRDPQLKKLRALAIAQQRIQGKTVQQIADTLGIDHKTVDRTLSWARRAGIFIEEQDRILQEMVPLARNTLIQALQEGDVTVALEVYKGIQLFGGRGGGKASANASSGDDELERWINQRRQLAAEHERAVDGELLPSADNGVGERKQLPPAGGEHLRQQTGAESGAVSARDAADGSVSEAAGEEIGAVDVQTGPDQPADAGIQPEEVGDGARAAGS